MTTPTPPPEPAAERMRAEIDYTVLHEFAQAQCLDYNALCSAVRAALAQPARALTDDMLLRFLHDLHANVPEIDRPASWSDFSDEQAARARAAWANVVAAAGTGAAPADGPRGTRDSMGATQVLQSESEQETAGSVEPSGSVNATAVGTPEVAPTLAEWNDPRVQLVYALVSDSDTSPPPEEHWDGWVSRRIVAALFAAPAASAPAGLVDAARELLELRDMKDRIEQLEALRNSQPALITAEELNLEAQYVERKPLAWAALRAELAKIAGDA